MRPDEIDPAWGAGVRRMRQEDRRPALAIASWMFVVAVFYFGAYYALVDPCYWMFRRYPAPKYRWGGNVAEGFFVPAYLVDLVVRPRVWGPYVPDPEAQKRLEEKVRYSRSCLPPRRMTEQAP